MIQVTETVWLPYPENKPDENRKHYLVSCYQTADAYELFYADGNWYDDYSDYMNMIVSDSTQFITHYADMPKAIDPTATEFNFTTAKMLMEGGEKCIATVTNIVYWIINGMLYCDQMSDDVYLSLAELNGTWRKV
jgi:hypothetical protein